MKVSFFKQNLINTPYASAIHSAIDALIDGSSYMVLGSFSNQFELEYSRYIESNHFIFASNGLDALILALVGVVLFINLVVKQTNYHLEDIVLFCVFFFVASLFYFLRIDATDEQTNDLKRFFLFFYFLAFSISTGIKKEGVVHNLRLFTRLCGGTKEKEGNEKSMSVSVYIYVKI